MEPVEIKVALTRAGISQADIARKCQVSRMAVTQIVYGRAVSHKIRAAIAEAINKDIRFVWPSTYVINGGPRKPGRPKAA